MMPVAMVGRADELSELVDAWSQTATGRARTVLITGSAGVGKSLLTASALDAFSPRPGTVLSGRARVHSPAPYDWLAAGLGGPPALEPPGPAAAPAPVAPPPAPRRQRHHPARRLR